jgi:hypothetical protein
VLPALAVRLRLGDAPLQVLAVVLLVRDGVGFTVTVTLVAVPAQEAGAFVVGVTAYTIEPAVASLGLVNTWLMALPLEALAPVMLPVLVPKVQAKVLPALAVRLRLGDAPLQVLDVVLLVSVGVGFTVTVTLVAAPAQEAGAFVVGVTAYTIEPAVASLGLVNTWSRLLPLEALAPVMVPVLVPNVQAKVLPALAVKLKFGLAPLQVLAVVLLVSVGVGFTVTVTLVAGPAQEPVVLVAVTA